MNKTELINEISEKTGVAKKDTASVVTVMLDTIGDVIADGDDVQLIGFGTFLKKHRSERIGRNPQTGEEMKVAACDVPSFKAGKALKDKVKGE